MISISVIQAKFIRSNVKANSTKLFRELSKEEKSIINGNIILQDKEEIILCYLPGTIYWWALTNSRLIIHENGSNDYIIFNQIEKVGAKEVFEEHRKLECRSVDLQLKSDTDIKVTVEERTWHVIYSIFSFLIGK